MNKYILKLVLASLLLVERSVYASPIIYADGDLAPLGAPDGVINAADYLIVTRLALGQLIPTELELSHGDLYPVGAPDGGINIQDMLLLRKLVSGEGSNAYVHNLTLFDDGPATNYIKVDGYTGPGAAVVSDPDFIDPDDATNTIWSVSISGGIANVFLGTVDLSSDPILDSGFDLSGDGVGQLVFDIKVNNISADAVLTVKMDSGYPDLGQVALTPSDYTIGSWRRVSISLADLLANPGPGSGLDLGNVVNAFVIEVTGGSADFYLDNIFVTRSCAAEDACAASVKTKTVYTLVWSDEFDGVSLSTDNWSVETGYGSNGWGNDEWQYYSTSTNNVSVSGGNLTINARCSNPPSCGKRDGTITSARINTLNKFSFRYGKVEARIKPPVGKGAWPAFWMLGSNFPSVGWPQSGEIDVMEMHNLYSDEYTTHFTMHYCDDAVSSSPCVYDPGWKYVSEYKTFADSLGDDFHVFSAEWNEDGITGKIDGQTYFSLPIDPATMDEFLKEFFIILNVAVGGTLGGPPDASTIWPQTMLVDYVRVYQEEGGDGTYTIGAPPPSPELGVYSESHVETLLPYSAIINGADFGGNVLNIDQQSANTAPLDGSVTLEVVFNNTGSSFGGFLFNFTLGRDISNYQTLKFSIDTAAMNQMADMSIELENPGQQKSARHLSSYTPTVNGNWASYEIPLNDFSGIDLANILYLGFWNPRTAGGALSFGTMYFDDIHFAGGQ